MANSDTARGQFVVIEGTDGAGSTTQGDLLCQHLRERGLEVVRTAQPSDLGGGQLIRRILRGQETAGDQPVDAAAVALLFAADRVDVGRRVIAPALARGAWVVCDRHLASSLAFQVSDSAHGGSGVSEQWVLDINRHALRADLTLWLDVEVEVALQRIAARGKPLERFETAQMLERVRQRYRQLWQNPPDLLGPLQQVDAGQDVESVACAVRRIVDDLGRRPERA